MKIYQVVHHYDEDGGFGDAIPEEEIIATFESLEDANAFVARFANPHVYDHPYQDLHCGKLVVMESDVIGKGELDLDKFEKEELDKYWWRSRE